MYVASNHFVWRLVPVSIASQIRQLLQDKQFELALQLAVSNRTTRLLNLVIKFPRIQFVPELKRNTEITCPDSVGTFKQ